MHQLAQLVALTRLRCTSRQGGQLGQHKCSLANRNQQCWHRTAEQCLVPALLPLLTHRSTRCLPRHADETSLPTSVNVQMNCRSSSLKPGMLGGRKFISCPSSMPTIGASPAAAAKASAPPAVAAAAWLGRTVSLPATVTDTACNNTQRCTWAGCVCMQATGGRAVRKQRTRCLHTKAGAAP